MELPEALRAGVDDLVAGVPVSRLARAANGLSDRYRYRDRDLRPSAHPPVRSSEDVAAYVAVRLPATYAAVQAALAQMAAALPGFVPRSLLDVGAGPGTVAWAATSRWPDLASLTLLERDAHMIAVGRRLAAAAGSASLRRACWVEADAMSPDPFPGDIHDLVVMAYALGEVDPAARARTVGRLWAATRGVLVLVEPGTPDGFARVREARARLVQAGAHVAAPCPHDAACPMAEPDWCHFAERVSRSRLHRAAKGAERSFEDEKFSFVALSRTAVAAASGRVLRHPQIRPGHVRIEVCGPDGLSERTVTRKDTARYRAARTLRWGSPVPWAAAGPAAEDGQSSRRG